MQALSRGAAELEAAVASANANAAAAAAASAAAAFRPPAPPAPAAAVPSPPPPPSSSAPPSVLPPLEGARDPSAMTVAALKQWLTDAGRGEVVWRLNGERAKKGAFVDAVRAVLRGE